MVKKAVLLVLITSVLVTVMWLLWSWHPNSSMRIVAHLPNDSQGWTICWAGGLVCVDTDNSKYISIADNGKVVRISKLPYAGLPLSVQCRRRLVFTQGYSADDKYIGTYLVMLDLQTAKYERILPGNKAFWIYPLYYYRGQFWSPNFDRLIAMSFIKRHASNTLVLINRHSKSTEEWVVPRGRIRSWAWPEDDSGDPWVLTVAPGMLYRVHARSQAGTSVPALDTAFAAMLSPRGDRAIGFQQASASNASLAVGAFYVDFEHSERRQAIILDDGSNIEGMTVQWAIWSPDGTKIALLLRSADSVNPRLYVGNPTRPLRVISVKGFRFPACTDALTQLTGLTLAWGEDSSSLFGILISENTDSQGMKSYAVGRYDVSQSDFF